MPSHKHKKRKKNHKQPKMHVTSISGDEDSYWNVKPLNSDSEDYDNEERLTSLVRTSYINHLHQALLQNFEGCIKHNNESASEESVQELVNKWSSVLEQKALRACMISVLYRRVMVSLIREIKASTNDGRLYVEDRSLGKLKIRFPLDKETQTCKVDDDQKTVCVAEIQTEPVISSLLDLPLPKTISSSKPYDPEINFSDSFCSSTGVSSTLNSKIIEHSSNQDICNITSTSDYFDSAECLLDTIKTTGIKNSPNLPDIMPLNTDLCDQRSKQIMAAENCSKKVNSSNLSNNIESFSQHLCKTIVSSGFKLQNIHEEKQILDQFSKSLIKDNIDARLTAMGLFDEFENETGNVISSLPSLKCKQNNWYAEEIAQSCNLTRVLLRISTRQRNKVLMKIKDLFGDENESLTEITEENIRICRKRIASVVVMELTPIYQAKRIASRYLFKFLAKKITKSLMEHSYAPDIRSIRWKVKEFFSDGKVIMGESDCIY